MGEILIDLPNEAATFELGARIAPLLKPRDVVLLSGPLGAGKTTLARGTIKRLAGAKEAPSPTFALVEPYETGRMTLYHFDLYRLAKPSDVWELGLEEALAEGASVIEWPEKIEAFLPAHALRIRLEQAAAGRRAIVSFEDVWGARLRRAGLLADAESPKRKGA
jgi:tRNA threonylcarbamoyladenosine biosynthesis protein TsaE